MTSLKTADTAVPVHPLLAQRWSPRGFDSRHELDDAQLTALLEAARWAPSANNTQPWRFLVARRAERDFEALTDLLAAGNRSWAPRASALVLVAAQTTDDKGCPRPWALYDTGQAVAALSMQAEALGLSVHQMGGFDAGAAAGAFGLADDVTPVVVVAIGTFDPGAVLPEPLAAREHAPRTREPVEAILLAVSPGGSRSP